MRARGVRRSPKPMSFDPSSKMQRQPVPAAPGSRQAAGRTIPGRARPARSPRHRRRAGSACLHGVEGLRIVETRLPLGRLHRKAVIAVEDERPSGCQREVIGKIGIRGPAGRCVQQVDPFRQRLRQGPVVDEGLERRGATPACPMPPRAIFCAKRCVCAGGDRGMAQPDLRRLPAVGPVLVPVRSGTASTGCRNPPVIAAQSWRSGTTIRCGIRDGRRDLRERSACVIGDRAWRSLRRVCAKARKALRRLRRAGENRVTRGW